MLLGIPGTLGKCHMIRGNGGGKEGGGEEEEERAEEEEAVSEGPQDVFWAPRLCQLGS